MSNEIVHLVLPIIVLFLFLWGTISFAALRLPRHINTSSRSPHLTTLVFVLLVFVVFIAIYSALFFVLGAIPITP